MYAYIYDNQWFQDGWSLLGNWTVGSGAPASMPETSGQALQIPDPIPPDAPPDFQPIYRTPELDPASPLSEMIAPDSFAAGKSQKNMALSPTEAPETSPTAMQNSSFASKNVQKALPSGMPSATRFEPTMGNRAPGWGWSFRTQFSDPSGYSHLSQLYFLLSIDGSTQNAIYLRYDQNTNRLYLRDSADTTWIGGYAPGSAVKLSNGNGTLDVSQSSVNSYGNYMDVFWKVIFKSTGQSQYYRAFMKATDDANNTLDWVEKGWHAVNMWAATGGVTPSSNVQSVGTTHAYTTTYTDPDQWTDLKYLFLNVAASAAGNTECIYAYYNVQANEIRLLNDAGTGWLGPITPGVTGDVETSWAIIHGAGSSVTRTGDKLTIAWSIEFKAPMAGTTKNIYLYAQDRLNWVSYWQYTGKVQITN